MLNIIIHQRYANQNHSDNITPTGIVIIKSVGEDVEKLELSYIASKNVNGAATFINSLAVYQKDK